MSFDGLSNEEKPSSIRQRLKEIFYVHRNRPIIPQQTFTHFRRNGPRLELNACTTFDDKDEPIPFGDPTYRPWPHALARPLVHSSGSISTTTSESSFLGGRTLSGASSRTSKSSISYPADGNEKPLPEIDSTQANHRQAKAQYFCSHCPIDFDLKDAWIIHERLHHERLFEYYCLQCKDLFLTEHALKTHVRQIHDCKEFTDALASARKVERLKKRTAWGCGICSALLLDWVSRCEHIATHCEAGCGRDNWSHSRVIIALLRQPVFDAVWRSYLIERHGNNPDSTFGVHWRTSTTGRSSTGYLQLQDWLEMGNEHNVDFIIKLAYDLGRRFVQGRSTPQPQSDGSNQLIPILARCGSSNSYRSLPRRSPGEEDVNLSSRSDTCGDASDGESDSCETRSLCSAYSESSLTDPDTTLRDVLWQAKTKIIDDLMCEVQNLLRHNANHRNHGNHAEESNSYTETQQTSKDGQHTSTPSRKRQRRLSNQSRSLEDSGEDGEEEHKKMTNYEVPGKTAKTHKLACPYYQKDPRIVIHRACAGPGWPSVHRIKEHLYRDHRLPIQCSRCGTPFDSDQDLQNHYRQADICHVIVLEPVQGLDKIQEKKLRSRKKLKTQSESDKWRAMYKILFPEETEDLIPSPYYESSQNAEHHRRHEATQIEQYMRRELAPLVRRELGRRVDKTCIAVQEQLMNELEPIIQQCQAKLFKSYRQTKDDLQTTMQTGQRADNFGVHESQLYPLESYSFEDPAFFDLSPPLPPLPTLCGLSGSFYVDPSASSISESDHNPASIQTSSGNISIDANYHYGDHQHVFPTRSFDHLDSLIQDHDTELLGGLHSDPIGLGFSGHIASNFVPAAGVSEDRHSSIGQALLQEGRIKIPSDRRHL